MILIYLAVVILVITTLYSAVVSFRQPEKSKRTWLFPGVPRQNTRVFVGVFTLALLIAIAFLLGHGSHAIRRSSRFLIPEGYVGWTRVEFEVQDAPALPVAGGQYVLKIPANGILRTSSPEQYGWANDQYFCYSTQSVRPLAASGPQSVIWGKINGEAIGASGKRKYEEFFVGTEEQFKSGEKKSE